MNNYVKYYGILNIKRTLIATLMYTCLSIISCIFIVYFNVYWCRVFEVSREMVGEVIFLLSVYFALKANSNYVIRKCKLDNTILFKFLSMFIGIVLLYIIIYFELINKDIVEIGFLDYRAVINAKYEMLNSPFSIFSFGRYNDYHYVGKYQYNYIIFIILAIIVIIPKGGKMITFCHNQFSKVNVQWYASNYRIRLSGISKLKEYGKKIPSEDKYKKFSYVYALFEFDDEYYLIRKYSKNIINIRYVEIYNYVYRKKDSTKHKVDVFVK